MNIKLTNLLKAVGPGILYAGAAIGGSHLIQSTRAGADYGFSLLILVILANLFKYPFFEFSYRYTSVKGKSLLEAYKELGPWVLWSFLLISIITGVINFAALALGASGILGYIIGLPVEPLYLSTGLVLFCVLLLLLGKYPLLDKVMKLMVVILAICTAIAFFMSLPVERTVAPGFEQADLFTNAGLVFVIALMGWMPTPIEASVWTSLWSLRRIKQKNYVPTLKESMFDFHLGYIGTTILAVFFLTLGAKIMYGSGIGFSNNGTEFTSQLLMLYTGLFGNWSAALIAPAAFFSLFSSLLTVVDAYPRSILSAYFLMRGESEEFGFKYYAAMMLSMSLVSLVVVSYFTKNLKAMMDLATIISFLAAPIFAYFNFKVVMSPDFPDKYKPKSWLKYLAIAGMMFLIGFSLIYIWSLLFF
ncbi:MAG: Nramp family divalent metal transporter [Candidatus Kapaibacterium sp.]|jgi:Mn2+/Fe2+ NRAMP family transporter|nr:Nramp family divalent metal transporter [Candidatus Kapabacteria bacterium]